MKTNTIIHDLGAYKDNNLYIKREDLIPVSFGGNKARKAIKFFEDIKKTKADCVVTYGSSSSNHCRVVSNIAASMNMPCYIIGPLEASEPTFNSRLMELFGAHIKVVPVEEVHDTIENCLDKLRKEGKNPYFIMGGGHGNIGTEAYVECYNEIEEYEKTNDIKFDYIFFASGTGTTQAGLVWEKLNKGHDREIVGISVARKNPRGRQVVIDSIKDYSKARGIVFDEDLIEKNTIFCDDYVGNGYGKDSDAVYNIIDEVMIKYGIPLDKTYTGKAFYGMNEYINKNNIKDKNILFIHTGGTPLFFDGLTRNK